MSDLAAIPYARGFPIDTFMAGLAGELAGKGLRLGGVVQVNEGSCESGRLAMELLDLAGGGRFRISRDRGAHASGCRLDASGLAAASAAFAAALASDVEIVLVNKFGQQEVLGGGLRQEIAATLIAGRPLLIAVREDFLQAWRDFAGEDWTELPPEAQAVESWALERARLAA